MWWWPAPTMNGPVTSVLDDLRIDPEPLGDVLCSTVPGHAPPEIMRATGRISARQALRRS